MDVLPGQADWSSRRIGKLDKVSVEQGVRVATGAVDLGDHDVGADRTRRGGETESETTTSAAAQRTGLDATASNPLTIISWAAIFGAATTASLVADSVTAIALLCGVGLGSALWFLLLAGFASHAGKRLGHSTLAVVDAVSGLGLLVFAALLGVRAFNES